MKIKKHKNKFLKKKILFLCISALIIGTLMEGKRVSAAVDDATGWFWGGGDIDNVQLSGDETGLGWISTNSADFGSGLIPYALNVPLNGDISGYAWSENVGWISFNGADLLGCPAGFCGAKSQGNANKFKGWARIMSIAQDPTNAGGWQGWISLSSLNCDADEDGTSEGAIGCPAAGVSIPNYGVGIDSVGQLSGYGWSDELGGISFNKVTTGAPAITIKSAINTIILKPAETLATLPPADKEVVLTWNVSGIVDHCEATCAPGSDCGSWTGTSSDDLIKGGSLTFSVKDSITEFGAICYKDSSNSNPIDSPPAKASIAVEYFDQACTGNVCGDFGTPKYGTSYNGKIDCTSNANCESLKIENWREVAP